MENIYETSPNRIKDSDCMDLMPSIIQDYSIGPGVYELPSGIPGGPSYSFPQAERFHTPPGLEKLQNSSLTPEKYKEISNTQGSIRARSVPTNDFSKPLISYLSDSPGPGQYEIPSTLYNKSITLGGKFKDLSTLVTPGPGAYDVSLSTELKFPQMKSPKLKPQIPLTANVSLINPLFKTVSPSFSMRTRPRDSSPFNGPGPGSYDLTRSSSPGRITIQGKTKLPGQFSTPGPGTYSLQLSRSSPSFSLGLPHKIDNIPRIPGPGHYNIDKKPSGPSFTIGKRYEKVFEEDLRDFNDLPSTFDTKGAVIFGKAKVNLNNGVPGPGQYTPQDLKSSQGFSQGKSSRDMKILNTPGPGEYNVDKANNGPNYTIGKRYSPVRIDSSPGPGNYDKPEFKTQSPMIRGKPKDIKQSIVPGPGAYDSCRSQSCLSFSQGKSQRMNYEKNDTPGPGAYDLTVKNVQVSGKFNTSQRIPKFKPDSAGEFLKIDMKPAGPSYSIQGKRPQKIRNNTPGPGAYNVNMKTKDKAPAYSMAPRREIVSRLSKTSVKKYTPIRSNR
ncbi:hypothetical protein SteCoe_26464 [Stentor coeruleus]|uniref:Uncharacterized protein n=1 Tax=Stentor coeruleus TaxID=5963 RepID=A0A1R2BD51_9CILI|nr:hypothetical protein SteCoe_26464 [Stentor coeruleus]